MLRRFGAQGLGFRVQGVASIGLRVEDVWFTGV